VLISPTFFEQVFRTKVRSAAFLYWKLFFLLFWRYKIGGKAAVKMLVKLTTGVYFTNIFTQLFCAKKVQKLPVERS
jgi:hypothetical protein